MLFYGAFFALLAFSVADTPANCSYADIEGSWLFIETARVYDKTAPCLSLPPTAYVNKRRFQLSFPNTASDEYGNEGKWTLIYNQGFEITVTGRTWFAYSAYSNSTSMCDKTSVGYSHNANGPAWACFNGMKLVEGSVGNVPEESLKRDVPKVTYRDLSMFFNAGPKVDHSQMYRQKQSFIQEINAVQSSWKAGYYPELDAMTTKDVHRRSGGQRSKVAGIPHAAPLSDTHRKLQDSLPLSFDWRNKDGQSWVSPVRNQGTCGSCYAFSSMDLLATRVRVLTNNMETPKFSVQDVVECSPYSQGCEGGFPYLVAGKYAADYGIVPETCNPYAGNDSKTCHTDPSCHVRQYVSSYNYVGGYYGACNEVEMQIALTRGPVSVSFMVYPDFQQYKSGIYVHTGLGLTGGRGHFNPFEITNHAVLMIGWGVENGDKFWIVQNSWGSQWGEDGYFRIRRGTDEVAIESMAVEVNPII